MVSSEGGVREGIRERYQGEVSEERINLRENV